MAEAEPAVQQDVSPPDDRPAEKLVTAGPPAAQAGGILTVDLARHRSQLARAVPPRHAGGMRRRGQGRRLRLRHRAGRRRAGARRLQDLLRRRSRRGARVRGVAPEPAIYVLNGLLPGTAAGLRRDPRAAGDRQHGRTRRMGRVLLGQAWRGGAALHVDTGMNRLGISVERSRGARAAHPLGKPRHHAADEPPRLRRAAGASAQRAQITAVPRSPHPLSRHPLLARQFVRHLPRRRRPLRPGAPGRRALRRQSDARAEQSDAAGGRIAGAHRAGAQRAARRDRRLRRRLDRQARHPRRGRRGRLCRRLSARGQRLRRSAGRQPPSSPASAARSSAASPWT